MLELHSKGLLTQQTQYNISDDWISASLDRCRQPGEETGNYIICSKDLLGMGPYNGESVCTNRVIPAKNIDSSQTGSVFVDQVRTTYACHAWTLPSHARPVSTHTEGSHAS
jgi:hypothetical protein